MTKRELALLAKQADDLGAARDKLHALKLVEKGLADPLRDALKAMRGPASKRKKGEPEPSIAGAKYIATLVVGDPLSITDVAAVRRAAGRKFIHCVKADLAGIRSVLGEAAADRLGTRTPTYKVRSNSTEPTKAGRKAAGKTA